MDDHCRIVKASDAVRQLLPRELSNSESGRIASSFVSKSAPGFLVRYPYGHEIVRDGRFQAPCAEPSTCASCSILTAATGSAAVSIPLSLVVGGAVEAFLPLQVTDDASAPSRPMRVLGAGEFFGAFETLDHLFGHPAEMAPWGVSAGARSVLVLTSRMSGRAEKLVRKALLASGTHGEDVPAMIETMQHDGWKLVAHLMRNRHDKEAPDWTAEILVLPGAARRELRTDPRAAPSLLGIADIGWGQSRHFRGHVIDEEQLGQNAHLKRRTISREDRIPMMGVLRQIVAMARGELPAFGLATSDAVMPLQLLQNELRQLPDSRSAIVMVPQHLLKAGDTGFISVRFNCLPAQYSDRRRNYKEFCGHVLDALHHVPDHLLDLGATRLLNGKEALALLASISKLPTKQVSSRHPFFTGCLKLVRVR